ncbi:hypothetical protein [Nocardia wallacei]|uniref:hypothetical protein n=1 Tax=Nocardia wallacei TaxID=480035 RepID=UPI0024574A87|nr:hypothetical protein [Nocardia wallacei]
MSVDPALADAGLLDTNIIVLRQWIDAAELPARMAISAITLAELSAGPHEVRSNTEQKDYDEHEERARRLEILQRVENDSIRYRSTPKPPASTAASPRLSSPQVANRDADSPTR